MKDQLIQTYQAVRQTTEKLCEPLEIEDYVIQSVDDVSPPKWHLAHTSWFFETFILAAKQLNYQVFHPQFQYLFNSYYQSLGQFFPRIQRGLLSRPTVKKIYDYRNHIDDQMVDWMSRTSEDELIELQSLIMLGLHHEQQHQELLLMDVKHNFSYDPAFPNYHETKSPILPIQPSEMKFTYVDGGVVEIGHAGDGFYFDNERPKHQQLLKPYLIATRLVTNAEYEEFILANGYENPTHWLSDGWECVLTNKWKAPLYWKKINNKWYEFTLSGMKELNPHEPVAHISYFEADAYAQWRNKRLPLEAEWENYVVHRGLTSKQGNFLETGLYHPKATLHDENNPQQFFGDLWEWTASSYSPYPGYKALTGALGEYNGKFMNNQFVLRGGSCVTPLSHIRTTYRNFFQPNKRWQFSGIRLASNIE